MYPIEVETTTITPAGEFKMRELGYHDALVELGLTNEKYAAVNLGAIGKSGRQFGGAVRDALQTAASSVRGAAKTHISDPLRNKARTLVDEGLDHARELRDITIPNKILDNPYKTLGLVAGGAGLAGAGAGLAAGNQGAGASPEMVAAAPEMVSAAPAGGGYADVNSYYGYNPYMG
jgi:hypothetical protein